MPQLGQGGAGFFGHGVWTMNRIARSLFATLLGALLLCMATLALADAGKPSERYTRVPAGADGIGKRYMGREIAQVMGWQGAAWLEREERVREDSVMTG